MITFSQNLWPALVCILVTVISWSWLVERRNRSAARVMQLRDAATYLKQHGAALESFLSDPDAPLQLKQLLLMVSDAMSDREIVDLLARWAATSQFDADVESAESKDMLDQLRGLQDQRPDLFDHFIIGVATAIAGATLRWPETAAIAERMFGRLATTPQRDAIIVTVTKFRPNGPFSMRPATAA